MVALVGSEQHEDHADDRAADCGIAAVDQRELERAPATCRPGTTLVVTPRLYTEVGLLVNSSSRGETDRHTDSNHNQATVEIRTSAGIVLEQAKSGFA